MGKNSSSRIIVEFNGLPGTGKTTIAKCLQEKLKQAGVTSTRRFEGSWFGRHSATTLLDCRNWLLFVSLIKFAKTLKPKRNRLKCIIGVLAYNSIYADFQKKGDFKVLIIDQGILQEYISIAHLDPIVETVPILDSLKHLKKNYNDVIRVDCLLDNKTSFERINKRPTNGARLDSLEDEELHKALSIQSNTFLLVRNCFKQVLENPVVTMDTTMSPEANADLLMNYILPRSR